MVLPAAGKCQTKTDKPTIKQVTTTMKRKSGGERGASNTSDTQTDRKNRDGEKKAGTHSERQYQLPEFRKSENTRKGKDFLVRHSTQQYAITCKLQSTR